jgi:hypothetical protein
MHACHGHGFEHLVLHAARDLKRGHDQARLRHVGSHVRNLADYFHPNAPVPPERRHGLAAQLRDARPRCC